MASARDIICVADVGAEMVIFLNLIVFLFINGPLFNFYRHIVVYVTYCF